MRWRDDTKSALFLLALGAAYTAYGRQYNLGDFLHAPGPGAFPLVIGLLLLAGSLILLILSLKKRAGGAGQAGPGSQRTVLLICGGLVAYGVAMPELGFLPTTAALNLYLIRVIGARGWLLPLVVAASVAVLYWWLFAVVLAVPLP